MSAKGISRVAAVTGANKGIGLAIVRQLALAYPSSPFHSGPFLIYLTARSPEKGAEAVKILNDDPQLRSAKVLAQDGGDTTIKFQELDISDFKSTEVFGQFLKDNHPEGIDFVINNAGVAFDGFDNSIVDKTIRTNYYGTLEATRTFLPLIKNGGRLVNVTSLAGRLHMYSPELREAFLSASKTGIPACSKLMEAFKNDVAEGTHVERGWPSAAYAVSKAGATAMTKAIAMEESAGGKGVLINACCPGRVTTDMSKGRGTKSPDEGAKTPVMLALADIGDQTGEFWQDEKLFDW